MKTKQITLSLMLLIAAAGCNKNAEVAGGVDSPAASKIETKNMQSPIAQSAPVPVNSPAKENQIIAPVKNNTDNKPAAKIREEGKAGTEQPAVKAQTTEQMLDGVVPNRDEPANSRPSVQKQREKKAEDEMLQEIGGQK